MGLTAQWGPIEHEIAAIVAEVGELEPADLVPGATLAEVDVDSLDLVEIAVEVERRFGVRFEEGELADVKTIETLAELARARGASAE